MNMRRFLKYILSAAYLLMMSFGSVSCSHEKNELAHDHEHEHGHHDHEGHDHDEHEGHNHGNGQEIVLEPEQAGKMGVKTAKVTPGSFADVLQVSGTVSGTPSSSGTVSAPTAGNFSFAKGIAPGVQVSRGQTIGRITANNISGGDANALAKVNIDNAKRELDRLKPLYEKQLVTAEKYNAALAAYESAKAAYSPAAASGTVVAPVSGTITEVLAGEGQFVDIGTEIARVSDGSTLTLTAMVPDRYAQKVGTFKDARIRLNGVQETIDLTELGGRRISGAGAVSSRPGYLPVVFSFAGNDPRIVPGSVVEVFLLGNEREGVVSVPMTAITEQQGNYFVYVKIDEEGYVKSPVGLGARDGSSVEILSGLHPGDEIVVEGVTALRLAETSGAVPEGHSHSH